MQVTARRAVDPIIASLLLIAIAVAAGIIVYVYVNSIAGNLTQGGGSQVSEGLSMDSYAFGTLNAPSVSVRDTGGSAVSINQVYFDGLQCQAGGLTCTGVSATEPTSGGCTGTTFPLPCSTGQYVTLSLTLSANAASGTSHSLRIVTVDGGTFTFTILAGRTG
ncbi:MAG TPA: archaellin/type IV pilin N-terminal domain-containing protein [Nitrososphaerales archaeon]|nr:archaellin/type IV pilin N-terminal domain-containing protein [Nitrososphaerales archaeon]HUK75094.1 archaellin/type IV pilin N-terminal domain-containing protein [Nitrososphaerales archaeon]